MKMKVAQGAPKTCAKEDFETLFEDDSKVMSIECHGKVKQIDRFSDDKPKVRSGSFEWDGEL